MFINASLVASALAVQGEGNWHDRTAFDDTSPNWRDVAGEDVAGFGGDDGRDGRIAHCWNISFRSTGSWVSLEVCDRGGATQPSRGSALAS